MKSTKFLDSLLEKHGIKNDRALALFLGVAQNTISQYRNGKRIMDNEMCLKIALALDIDPLQVIMAADIDRAEKAGQRSLWESFTRKAAAFAGVAVMASSVNLFVTTTDAQATPRLNHAPTNLHYVKLLMRLAATVMAKFLALFATATLPATA